MHAKTVERIFFDCALPQPSDRYKRYEGVTRLGIAQADVVGDRFHWTMYINKVLDDQRKHVAGFLLRGWRTLRSFQNQTISRVLRFQRIHVRFSPFDKRLALSI